MLPVTAGAYFSYTTNNGSITITGYTGPGGGAIIPSTTNGLLVTSIGLWAFAQCPDLTHVTIPSSVTSIGVRAFYSCPKLTAITVDAGNSVYSSAAGVLFRNNQTTLIQCPTAKRGSYEVPHSVTSIEDHAFSSCSYLTNVTIGSNVAHIGSYAFHACTNLASVTIPDSVTSIGWGAFHSSGLASVTIPDSITSIGDVAFQGCTNLTRVEIPNSVTSIGYYAFCYCTSLTNITIPDSVASIGTHAFDYCSSLASVTIGTGVTTIGENAFVYCTNLTGVYFRGDAPADIDTHAFLAADQATIYYLPGTRGWGPTFNNLPTAPWLLPSPVILGFGPDFGIQADGFGFVVSWATNASVAVEACTNSGGATWIALSTNTLSNGWFYFSDPAWTDYTSRFYRLRSP